jgi:hypothetical protein
MLDRAAGEALLARVDAALNELNEGSAPGRRADAAAATVNGAGSEGADDFAKYNMGVSRAPQAAELAEVGVDLPAVRKARGPHRPELTGSAAHGRAAELLT